MKSNAFTDSILRHMVRKVIQNPDKNLPRALALVEKLDKNKVNGSAYPSLEKAVYDQDNNWNILIHNVFRNIAPEVLDRLSTSLLLNSAMKSYNLRMKNIKKYDCNIPWAILMDPTASCNLKCTGCWAAEYGKNCNLPYEVLDRIIQEGNKLGIYTYLFSGGEPLVRKRDVIRLCEAHSCVYQRHFGG